MIKVLIVDDHQVLLDGLKRIIEFERDIVVPFTARNATEALKIATREPVDIVILDISMEGRSGLDIIPDLRSLRPNAGIIMLSMFHEERFAVRAFRLGAAGYLTKEMAAEEIIQAIRKVHEGGKYISAKFADHLVDELLNPADKKPHELLSEREFDVLLMIAAGKSVTNIARELSLSDRTVSTYRRRILEKMQMTSSAELIRYALGNGLCH
jgi:DNA-binding NarL/FixJ family response regulator